MQRTAAFLLALCVPIEAAGQELVTLDRGSAYELTWAEKRETLSARVYVTRKAAKPTDPIGVTLRAIADGRRTDPTLTGGFQISPAQLTQTTTAVDVVGKAPTVRTGTYEATLTFTSGEVQQNVNVQLIVPAATLVVPSSLQIARIGWPFGGQYDETNVELVLLESSGKSHASVKVQQSEPFANAEGQYGFALSVAPAIVEKGDLKRLQPIVSGRLPLGLVSSKLTISSDQLQSPLTVPVQIRTRLTRLVLVIIVVFGLALGFLTRIVLKPRIELGEARERAIATLDKMIDKIPDAEYRNRMTTARNQLALAARAANATPATINAAITAAEGAQKDASDNLKDRMQKAEGERDALAGVITPAWTLPPDLSEAVRAAAERLRAASERLKIRDAVGVSETVRTATSTLREAMMRYATDWKNIAARFLTQFRTLERMVDSARRADYQAQIKTVEDQVAKTVVTPAATTAELKAVLEAIHGATQLIPALESRAADEVGRSLQSMLSIIGTVQFRQNNLWKAAQQEIGAFVKTLRDVKLEAPETWGDLDAKASAIAKQWRDALIAQTDDSEKVAEAFDAGNFAMAARELETAVKAKKAPVTLGDVGAAAASARMTDAAQRGGTAASPAPAMQEKAPDTLPTESLLSFRRRTRTELARDNAFQWFVSAIGLAFVGYLMFADKFVGTSGDLMTAFFWGFSTDIGVDALVNAAKSKPTT